MAAQTIASRPRRPQQTEPDDIMFARAVQFTEWARRNIVLVVAVAVTALVLIGGFFWYRADRDRRSEEAAIAFLQVEQSVYTGDPTIATRELQLYLQRHGGTAYADEARVLLGQIHLREGQTTEAINVLQPVADRLQRSPVGPQAAILMATAQEAAGQTEAAIQTYLRVADRAETPFRQQEGLVGAAILREQAGDFAGAAALYRRLVGMTEPGTGDRSIFEMRLAEAEARAGQ
jgi:predicted negative regulator of RcsB-dependent stress response